MKKNLKVKPNDFACNCSPLGKPLSEGKQRCLDVMEWALKHLKADRENIVDSVVWALNWSYGASVTGIGNDQWSAISTQTHDVVVNEKTDSYDRVDPAKFTTYIQCDNVEDGFAFTLRAYYDKFGKERKGRYADD